MEQYGRLHDSSDTSDPISPPREQPLLVATRSLEEMKTAPVGRCFVATTFVVWCATPELQGSIFWGHMDEATVREALLVGEFVRHPAISPRRRALTDCSAVERIEPDLLLAFSDKHRGTNERWATTIERQAFVVPAGLPGMMMAGSLSSALPEHPVRVVRELDEAFAHISHPLARVAHVTATAMAAEIRGAGVLLTRLRVCLRRTLDSASIETCAASLGMSARTLQRQLAELDTSFSDELRKVRIATAESLLLHTDLKIEAIATQVGFGTASRLTSYLRRELNVTATELRANRGRHRASPSRGAEDVAKT